MGKASLAVLMLSVCAPAQDAPRPAPTLDVWFEAEWKKLGLKPAAPADDAAFLRRVRLDLSGTLPDPAEVRSFLASSKKDKRAAKIEEILSSRAAADYFAHLWVQWLMGYDIEFGDLRGIDLGTLIRWLRSAWEKDLPYDEMLRQILTARGPLSENPAGSFFAKYLAAGEPPGALAGRAARLTLGREIRCAQCHDHPFEKVTQEDFWGYAAFFRPLRAGNRSISEAPVEKPAVLREDMGEQFVEPRFVDGRRPLEGESRADALARLTLTMQGDVAAAALVDRYWKLFFGRSIAPGRHGKGRPDLLAFLVRGFVEQKWSVRWLVRAIAGSRVYELTSEGGDAPRREYAVGPLKMMNPVQFIRTWNFALQLDTYYRQLYEKDPARAAFFADPDLFWVGQTMYSKELLFPKGRDPEEVLSSGTDRLALKLMNNRDLQLLMIAQFGLVRKVMKQAEDPGKRIEELFLLMVSRPPTKAEKSRLVDHAKGTTNPYHGYTDVFWMLFNSSEFVFVG